MTDDLLTLLLLVPVGVLVGWAYRRGHRHRLAKAFAVGRAVEFDGAVLGSMPYCHPVGGVLAVGDGTLTWLSGHRGKRYPVPVQRLVVQGMAPATHRAGPKGPLTDVTCLDGPTGSMVTLQLPTDDLRYLATVLPLPGVEPAVRPDSGRSILGR